MSLLKNIFISIADWRDRRSNDLYRKLMLDEIEKSAAPREGQSRQSVLREHWPIIETAFYTFLENRYKLPFDEMHKAWKKSGRSDSAFFERVNNDFLAFQIVRQAARSAHLVQTNATSSPPRHQVSGLNFHL
jgi:hypothetical protein